MKKLIHEIEEVSGSKYQLWAELSDATDQSKSRTLSFKSVWTGAKDPTAEQKRWEVTLSPEGVSNLKSLLEGLQ